MRENKEALGELIYELIIKMKSQEGACGCASCVKLPHEIQEIKKKLNHFSK